MKIQIDPKLFQASGEKLHLASVSGTVTWREKDPQLWDIIEAEIEMVKKSYDLQDLAKIPQIACLRDTYRKLGKKPQKYRGSNESLLRRILKSAGLYQVSNLVDINNLLSLRTHRSVGSYDLDCLQPPLTFGVGKAEEPYQGIGRGQLNIANMPVFRDQQGPFGSATSDSERSKVSSKTRHLLLIIIGFDGKEGLTSQAEWAGELLTRFAAGQNLKTDIHSISG